MRVAVLDGPIGQPLRTPAGALVVVRTDADGTWSYEGSGSLDLRFRPFDPGIRNSANPNGWLPMTPEVRRLRLDNGGSASDVDFAL